MPKVENFEILSNILSHFMKIIKAVAWKLKPDIQKFNKWNLQLYLSIFGFSGFAGILIYWQIQLLSNTQTCGSSKGFTACKSEWASTGGGRSRSDRSSVGGQMSTCLPTDKAIKQLNDQWERCTFSKFEGFLEISSTYCRVGGHYTHICTALLIKWYHA